MYIYIYIYTNMCIMMPYGSYMLRHCNIGKALPILSSEAAPMWPSPAVSGETHSSARSLGVGTLTDLSYG